MRANLGDDRCPPQLASSLSDPSSRREQHIDSQSRSRRRALERKGRSREEGSRGRTPGISPKKARSLQPLLHVRCRNGGSEADGLGRVAVGARDGAGGDEVRSIDSRHGIEDLLGLD
jgi:hypothetical protein